MNLKKITGLFAAACALVAAFSVEAAAQAPSLSVRNSGNVVAIEWSAVPGATGYLLQAGTSRGASNIASVNVPAVITRIVVTAPNGYYFMRVAGTVGSVVGPMSEEREIEIGGSSVPAPGPCAQPNAPNITVTPNGLGVSVTWNQVSGAAGYRIQYSMTQNGTDLERVVPASQTSASEYAGFAGNFFVRVVAVAACGASNASETKAFQLGNAPGPGGGGSGPRTPDPAPGTLLPLPGYAAGVVQQMAAAYRGDLLASCAEHGGNNIFMFRVLNALRQRDSRWGLNYKRGHSGDLSQDIITYNPTNRPDEGETQIYVIDMIGGHCGGNPSWNWQDQTGPTWAAGAQGLCANRYCAKWTIQPYVRAGFPAITASDQQQQ